MARSPFSYDGRQGVGGPASGGSDDGAALPCADKLAFDTQRQAAAAANVAAYQHGAVVRPYVCRYCGLWHLSSS